MKTFEDFVPLTEDRALISSGSKITSLTDIEHVAYSLGENGRVLLGKSLRTMASGSHLRLGGLFDGNLVYSDKFRVIGAATPEGAHQPYMHHGSCYYTFEWPLVRIHKDGELYLGHFGNMVQVGNPHWAGDTMYFEARDTASPTAVDAWQVWKQKKGGEPEFVCMGANPAVLGDWLFYGKWNGSAFEYFRRPVA